MRRGTAGVVAAAFVAMAGCGGTTGPDDGDAAGPRSPSASAPASTPPPTTGSPAVRAQGPPAEVKLTPAFTTPRQLSAIFALDFSPDGRMFATGDSDGDVRLWHSNGTAGATLKGHRGDVEDVAFAPDGRTLASVSADGTLRLWDLATGRAKVVKITDDDAANELQSVTWSPDGATVVTGGWGESGVRVLAPDGTVEKRLPVDGDVTAVSFSPDGATLAVGDIDKHGVELWRVADWSKTVDVDVDFVGHDLVYSPDGSGFYGAVEPSPDDGVDLWDAATVTRLHRTRFGDDVGGVDLSPDGAMLAATVGLFDGALHLLSTADYSSLGQVKVDFPSTDDVAFSPAQPLLVVANGANVLGFRLR